MMDIVCVFITFFLQTLKCTCEESTDNVQNNATYNSTLTIFILTNQDFIAIVGKHRSRGICLTFSSKISKISLPKGDGNHGKPDAIQKSEIMIQGWSTPKWSKLVGNCIFAEALGAYSEIFKQTHQKRPEAKVSLGGHLTTMSK